MGSGHENKPLHKHGMTLKAYNSPIFSDNPCVKVWLDNLHGHKFDILTKPCPPPLSAPGVQSLLNDFVHPIDFRSSV